MRTLSYYGMTYILEDRYTNMLGAPDESGHPLNSDGAQLQAALAALYADEDVRGFLAPLSSNGPIFVLADGFSSEGKV